jgi:SAM-dependent methyltransferase
MDRETEKLVRTLPYTGFDVLEISGNKWASFGFRTYRDVDYPAYDLCKDRLPERFDLIIGEQVFEHLLWPYRALRNVATMLRPGGYVLLTTPFLVCIHPTPEDCTRWSEVGLKYLMAECGFPLAHTVTGAWGNRACVIANLRDGHKWASYIPWMHSLRNDATFPIHVWALGRKSEP